MMHRATLATCADHLKTLRTEISPCLPYCCVRHIIIAFGFYLTLLYMVIVGPSEPVSQSKSPLSSTSPRSPRRRLSSTPQPVTNALRNSGNHNNNNSSGGGNAVNGTGHPPGPGHLNNHRSNSFTQNGHSAVQSSSTQTSPHNSYNPLNYTPTLANPNAIFSPPSPTSVPPLNYLRKCTKY